jgi:hypothetical protein
VSEAFEAAKAACKAADPLWPVGSLQSQRQLIEELKIAGERMEIQAGIMKDWSDRFFALAAAVQRAMDANKP